MFYGRKVCRIYEYIKYNSFLYFCSKKAFRNQIRTFFFISSSINFFSFVFFMEGMWLTALDLNSKQNEDFHIKAVSVLRTLSRCSKTVFDKIRLLLLRIAYLSLFRHSTKKFALFIIYSFISQKKTYDIFGEGLASTCFIFKFIYLFKFISWFLEQFSPFFRLSQKQLVKLNWGGGYI